MYPTSMSLCPDVGMLLSTMALKTVGATTNQSYWKTYVCAFWLRACWFACKA